jgi:UDP-N-acetylmuramate--alanine ligase
VDDYAHHPSEIKATLSTASLLKSGDVSLTGKVNRVVAIFQPHRYSRVTAFLDDFAAAFADADEVIVTDVYSAGESAPSDFCTKKVGQAIALHHPHVQYCPSLDAVSTVLKERLQPGDLAIFLGAGNLNRIIPDVMEAFMADEMQAVQQA